MISGVRPAIKEGGSHLRSRSIVEEGDLSSVGRVSLSVFGIVGLWAEQLALSGKEH